MSSPERAAPAEPRIDSHAAEGTVGPLLDAAFGFFVWMAHLMTIYVAAALACGLGIVSARGGSRSPAALTAALAVTTAVAAAIVALHARRRWRQLRDLPERRFRMTVTLGADAIAIVAILWQLLAIGLVPSCA